MEREAITRLQTSLAVTAGAGAGKTTTLVATYLRLLDKGLDGTALTPEQIVAITFTEKAAGEMRARVVGEVAERDKQEPGGRWREMLGLLQWAPISTIHSFCASILREFAVLAGLDPEFAVLDADEYDQMQGEVCQEVVRRALVQGEARLARLLAHHGDLAGLLEQALGQLSTLGASPGEARQATAQAHSQQIARAPGLAGELGLAIDALDQARGGPDFSPKAKYAVRLEELLDAWRKLGPGIQADPLGAPGLGRIRALLGGQWGKLKPLKDDAIQAAKALEDLMATPLGAQLTDDLLSLAQEAHADLARESARRAVVGFDGLLIGVRDLLVNHPDVLQELRDRWRVLLVDEYQDVDPVQGQVVQLLAGLEGPPDDNPPRLMIVGDRKQSIYSFRGADVGVFSQTAGLIHAAGGRECALAENFRSAHGLVNTFNRLFEQVFSLAGGAELALGSVVEFAPDDQQTPARPEPGPDHPLAEILEVEGGEGLNAVAWRQREAEALAAHLARLVREQDVATGDIAILFRRLTKVEVYEDALRAAGLDHYTVRGRGFHQCQEVRDVALGLAALLEPDNEIALAGLLRSPLVGLSDESLLALAVEPDGEQRGLSQALRQGVDLPPGLGEEQSARWASAQRLLKGLGGQARRMEPAELVEALLAHGQAMAVLMGAPGGEQAMANLRKLLESARAPGGWAGRGAAGFVQQLLELVSDPSDDPQAPLMGEEAQVIRLMSVHQAKGLQFKVVALADMAGGSPGGGALARFAPGGVTALPARDSQTGKLMANPVSRLLRQRSQEIEKAEEARLFYVACTRAQERLVLSLTGARVKGNWVGWTREIAAQDPGVRVISAGAPDQAALPEPPLTYSWRGCLPPEPGPRAQEGAELVERLLAPQAGQVALVQESVSAMEAWLECPRLYVFTRRWGLDTAALPGRGGSGDGRPQAAELGSRVHQLLERTDLALGPAGVEAASLALGGASDDELAAQAVRLAQGVWDTELGEILARAKPAQVWREQAFRLWLPAGEGGPELDLMGEIDLLVFGDGPPLIVDYKVTKEVAPDKYRDQLMLYALAVEQAGEGGGDPPRAMLCYLREAGASLVPVAISHEDLAQTKARVLRAGGDIAALPPRVLPGDVPPGVHCDQHCPLKAVGLCQG